MNRWNKQQGGKPCSRQAHRTEEVDAAPPLALPAPLAELLCYEEDDFEAFRDVVGGWIVDLVRRAA